jgi:recombination protein RecT
MMNVVKKIPFSVAIRSDAYKTLINNTLGDPKVAQRFIAEISTAVSNNPKLGDCDPATIISAGLNAQSMDLPLAPTLGQCYIIPYGNKAQFQIGWKGLVQLAIRSGQYLTIGASEVREGEYLGRDEFGEPLIKFNNNPDLTKSIVGYMAYLKLVNGFTKKIYWSKEECEAHANKYSKAHTGQYSKGGENDKWAQDFDSMALKTVLKQLISKWGVMSVEMRKAIETDQAVINGNKTEYVDNEDTPTTTEAIEAKVDDNGVVAESEEMPESPNPLFDISK